jgi:AhpD family alkylhydroperoxidase
LSDATTERSLAVDPQVTELVALGAAVGSGCEACFRSHYDAARAVGLSDDEISQAVQVARAVRDTSADRMLELAARKLDVAPASLTTAAAAAAVDSPPDEAAAAACC